MADGHLNKCKECTKSDVRRHRRENDSVREYDRLRGNRQDVEYRRTYNEKNKEKRQAYGVVWRAIVRGDLVRGRCRVDGCEAEKVHAHHEDYSKPLEVEWLCAVHHRRFHAAQEGAR